MSSCPMASTVLTYGMWLQKQECLPSVTIVNTSTRKILQRQLGRSVKRRNMKASVTDCIFYQCLTSLHSQNGVFNVAKSKSRMPKGVHVKIVRYQGVGRAYERGNNNKDRLAIMYFGLGLLHLQVADSSLDLDSEFKKKPRIGWRVPHLSLAYSE